MAKAWIYGKCADESGSSAFTTFKNTWDTISNKISKATVYGSLGESSALGWGLQDIGRLELELIDATAAEKTKFITGISASSELHCFVSYSDTRTYPVGKFYINKVESKPRNNGNYDLTITAYDSLMLAESTVYVPSSSISLPTSPQAVLVDCLNQCSLAFYDSSQFSTSQVIEELYEGFTCRQMINYIGLVNAGLGKKGSVINWLNARSLNGINVEPSLLFSSYGHTTKSISWNLQYQGENRETTDGDIVYGGVITGSGNNLITYPSQFTGQAANFENPFMNQELAQGFYEKVVEPLFSYTPLEVRYHPSSIGDFGTLIGTKLNVYQKDGSFSTSYLSDFCIVFGGGFSVSLKGFGASDSEKEFIISPTQAQIKRQAAQFETALKEASALINGVNGGYIKILDLDGDGSPDNIFVTDVIIDETDIVKSGTEYVLRTGTGVTNVLRINYEGMGISSGVNAGTAIRGYTTAITGSGVNATAINTGELNANLISTGTLKASEGKSYWNLNTGEFQSGNVSYVCLPSNGIVEWYLSYKKIGCIAPTSSGSAPRLNIIFDETNASGVSIGRESDDGVIQTIGEFVKGDATTGGSLTVRGSEKIGITYKRISSSGTPYENRIGLDYVLQSEGDYDFAAYTLFTSRNRPALGQERPSGVSTNEYYGVDLDTLEFHFVSNFIPRRTSDGLKVDCKIASHGYVQLYVVFYDQLGVEVSQVPLSEMCKSVVMNVSTSVVFPDNATQFRIAFYPETAHYTYWAGWKDVTIYRQSYSPIGVMETAKGENAYTVSEIGPPRMSTTMGSFRLGYGSARSSWWELTSQQEIMAEDGNVLAFTSNGLIYDNLKLAYQMDLDKLTTRVQALEDKVKALGG